jgi:hypothetical protein
MDINTNRGINLYQHIWGLNAEFPYAQFKNYKVLSIIINKHVKIPSHIIASKKGI